MIEEPGSEQSQGSRRLAISSSGRGDANAGAALVRVFRGGDARLLAQAVEEGSQASGEDTQTGQEDA